MTEHRVLGCDAAPRLAQTSSPAASRASRFDTSPTRPVCQRAAELAAGGPHHTRAPPRTTTAIPSLAGVRGEAERAQRLRVGTEKANGVSGSEGRRMELAQECPKQRADPGGGIADERREEAESPGPPSERAKRADQNEVRARWHKRSQQDRPSRDKRSQQDCPSRDKRSAAALAEPAQKPRAAVDRRTSGRAPRGPPEHRDYHSE